MAFEDISKKQLLYNKRVTLNGSGTASGVTVLHFSGAYNGIITGLALDDNSFFQILVYTNSTNTRLKCSVITKGSNITITPAVSETITITNSSTTSGNIYDLTFAGTFEP